MNYFCTLFDGNYLSRGLAMYRSLKKHGGDFHLYIFPFDNASYELLVRLALDHVTLVKMDDFENVDLLRIKPTRSKGEYCWTCTPSILYYCITKFDLPLCTYLDADLFFFSDPGVLINELGKNSILITEHRYSEEYDHSEINGIYCVQFISFRNDKRGMAALMWWKDSCIEWCFNRLEDGKFGDQKYLDDWPIRFEGTHVLQHLGGGVAPWNVQQYKIGKVNSDYLITDRSQVRAPLVFFHFHWVRFLKNQKVDLGCYNLDFPYVHDIYEDWIRCVLQIDRELYQQFQFKLAVKKERFLKELKEALANMKRRINGTYFIVDLKTFGISG